MNAVASDKNLITRTFQKLGTFEKLMIPARIGLLIA
jgi:hypothetical protein